MNENSCLQVNRCDKIRYRMFVSIFWSSAIISDFYAEKRTKYVYQYFARDMAHVIGDGVRKWNSISMEQIEGGDLIHHLYREYRVRFFRVQMSDLGEILGNEPACSLEERAHLAGNTFRLDDMLDRCGKPSIVIHLNDEVISGGISVQRGEGSIWFSGLSERQGAESSELICTDALPVDIQVRSIEHGRQHDGVMGPPEKREGLTRP